MLCHLHPGQVGHHNRKSFLAGGSVGLLFCWWGHIVAASFLDFVANAAFVVVTVVVIPHGPGRGGCGCSWLLGNFFLVHPRKSLILRFAGRLYARSVKTWRSDVSCNSGRISSLRIFWTLAGLGVRSPS